MIIDQSYTDCKAKLTAFRASYEQISTIPRTVTHFFDHLYLLRNCLTHLNTALEIAPELSADDKVIICTICSWHLYVLFPSRRIYRPLEMEGIDTIADLLNSNMETLRSIRGLDESAVDKINITLCQHNLYFGMLDNHDHIFEQEPLEMDCSMVSTGG
ncbi:hypothetical protein [Pedobacter frigidisoli]|uniref:hypothetical protein n=1 Tax=Pedobacter frigidisoli TaxID=2530455 RepID=UPI00292CEA87|nr:hypothetical protein [Pedobacter frigidisoli]